MKKRRQSRRTIDVGVRDKEHRLLRKLKFIENGMQGNEDVTIGAHAFVAFVMRTIANKEAFGRVKRELMLVIVTKTRKTRVTKFL